ncbi:MAG: hypothetical protein LBV54_08395 [Puniceicoccales bacterium]|nr:hypothetical protein [Puniceicoccales bacterium]
MRIVLGNELCRGSGGVLADRVEAASRRLKRRGVLAAIAAPQKARLAFLTTKRRDAASTFASR